MHASWMGSSSSLKDACPARTSPGAPGVLQRQAARSRLQAQEQLDIAPATRALGSPGTVWAQGTPSPNASPSHHPGAGISHAPPSSLRHGTLRGARAGANLHPKHLGEPPALSRGTRAPTWQPHGTHRGTSCALGDFPRGATRPRSLGAEGSTRSRPSTVQGSRMPALPCPQAAFSLPLSPELIRAQSRPGPKNSSTSPGWDLAPQQALKLSAAPLGLPRASGARTGPSRPVSRQLCPRARCKF